MKPLLLLSPLLLVACAPRAILLVDAGAPPPGNRGEGAVASASPDEEPLPAPDRHHDGIGLLEPSTITRMPDEREMRPTVDPDDNRPVIATPPANGE